MNLSTFLRYTSNYKVEKERENWWILAFYTLQNSSLIRCCQFSPKYIERSQMSSPTAGDPGIPPYLLCFRSHLWVDPSDELDVEWDKLFLAGASSTVRRNEQQISNTTLCPCETWAQSKVVEKPFTAHWRDPSQAWVLSSFLWFLSQKI